MYALGLFAAISGAQVVPGANLFLSDTRKQGSVDTLYCTLVSDGSPCTLLAHPLSTPVHKACGFKPAPLPEHPPSPAELHHECTPRGHPEPVMEPVTPRLLNSVSASLPAQQPSSDACCTKLLQLNDSDIPDGQLSPIRRVLPSTSSESRVKTPSFDSQDLLDLAFHSGSEDDLIRKLFSHGSIQTDGAALRNAAGSATTSGTPQSCNKRTKPAEQVIPANLQGRSPDQPSLVTVTPGTVALCLDGSTFKPQVCSVETAAVHEHLALNRWMHRFAMTLT